MDTGISTYQKAGIVTTDAAGLASVVFRHAMPADLDYALIASIYAAGLGLCVTITSTSQTGFAISTWVIGGAGSPAPGVTVHWLAVPISD